MKTLLFTILNYRFFDQSIKIWAISLLFSVPIHFFLSASLAFLLKPTTSDIDNYLCCTTSFMITRDIRYGLVLLILMYLVSSFLLDKHSYFGFAGSSTFNQDSASLNDTFLSVTTLVSRLLISFWLYRYWINFISDIVNRQILTSGNTIVPSGLSFGLFLNTLLVGYIYVTETSQEFSFKIPQLGIYFPSMVRVCILLITLCLFNWFVFAGMQNLIIGYIATAMFLLFVALLHKMRAINAENAHR